MPLTIDKSQDGVVGNIISAVDKSGAATRVLVQATQSVDSSGNPVVYADAAGYPAGATVLQLSSGNVANAVASVTLPAVAGKTNYLADYSIAFAGATAASVVLATVTGLLGGTRTIVVAVPAGVTVGGTPTHTVFNPPLVASAPNVAIVVSLPALGPGNTNAAVNAHGFQI